MDERIRQLSEEFRVILGGQVSEARLLIWPESNFSESDVRLNFALSFPDRRSLSCTLRTSSDGETPLLQRETIESPHPYSALAEKIEEWKRLDHEGDLLPTKFDAFDLSEAHAYGGICGHTISRIDLFCMPYLNEWRPEGLQLSFSSGKRIWSLAHAYGNRIELHKPLFTKFKLMDLEP